MKLKVAVKKVDRSRLRFLSVRQWVVPESVTYTVETDGEWDFDWYGVNGKFYKFNKE